MVGLDGRCRWEGGRRIVADTPRRDSRPTAAASSVPQADGSGPSVNRSDPPRCSSRAVSQLRSSGAPLKLTDCTYCGGRSGPGSTKPSVSMISSAVAELHPGPRERRGVQQVDALAGHREDAERGPDVPRAQPAGVVVAGQSAPAEPEHVVHAGVHDLGGPVRPAGVVVGPGRLHVRLVVQALEAVERVAGAHLLEARPLADLLDRVGAVAEERVEQLDEGLVAAGQLDPGLHVVHHPERVVPLAALVVLRVDQQPGVGVERVAPLGGQAVELLGRARCRRRRGRPWRCSGSAKARSRVWVIGWATPRSRKSSPYARRRSVSMWTSAQSQSMPGTPSWQRSARKVWASALPWRENRSAPLAIR